MLISVHLPKTAGASFKAALQKYFGDDLRLDYADKPINFSPAQRRLNALMACVSGQLAGLSEGGQPLVIHGHFMPLKYRFLNANTQFVTWMRDPVERLASHYYYWRRDYDPAIAGALRQRMIEEDWSLERFCLGPELRNIYCQFIWGFPFSRFSFVGITEHYDDDFAWFSRHFLGGLAAPDNANVNKDKTADCYITDAGFREAVSRHHSKDMALYQRALELRSKRIAL